MVVSSDASLCRMRNGLLTTSPGQPVSCASLGKVYVQDLLWDARHKLVPLILEKRAYIYICGDAKSMAHSVEQKLMAMLGEAKGGSAEVEGAKEFKLLKERQVSVGQRQGPTGRGIRFTDHASPFPTRQRLLLDVWS